MATVADIHISGTGRAGWLLMIEGMRHAWTNVNALVGTGASSWIGTSYGDREILLGLEMPGELPFGVTDPWKGRIDQPRGVEFGLVDLEGSTTVAAIFKALEADETTDSMGSRLSPLDDPAPATIAGPAQTPIDLWDRDVGIEHIGPAGQRRYYWIEPTGAPPGLDHFAGVDWPPVRITDSQTVHAGRKIAVYRIVQDPDTGAWPSWTLQHAGGSLLWQGALKDIGRWSSTAKGGRRLSLVASGPPSWLRKSAGLSRPTTWYKPQGGVSLVGDETLVAAFIGRESGQVLDEGIIGVPSTYDAQTFASGNTLVGLTTPAAIVAKIAAIVETMISGVDSGGVLAASNSVWQPLTPGSFGYWQQDATDGADRDVTISADGRTFKIKCEQDSGTADGYRLGIALDARVWQLLGWDVAAPNFERPTLCPVGGAYGFGETDESRQMPPYHYIGYFSTKPSLDAPEYQWENGGAWRVWDAPYQGGTVTLDHDGGDELRLAVGDVRCEGQLASPWTYGAQLDGVNVSASGWWVFRGQRLTVAQYLAGEVEGEDFAQVALCEWVATADGDGIAEDSAGFARIRIVRWEDPRALGLPYDRIAEPWVSETGALECAPIAVLGGIALHVGAPDWRHRLIPRTLLSSGTAVWDDSSGEVVITPGDNHPGDLPGGDPWAGDVEVADLGLCIPPGFVDWDSWYTACEGLPGGRAGALNRVSYPIYGSHRLEGDGGVLVEAMRGAGLAWSLKRKAGGVVPAFGAYDPLRKLSLADVEVALNRADMAELESPLTSDRPMWRGEIELRGSGPYDRFVFSTDRDPLANDYAYPLEVESNDEGRRYRDGRIEWPVEDGGLRRPTPWLGTPAAAVYDWTGAAAQRFADGFGPRHARQLRIYRNTYNGRFAGRLGLGTVVRVIDPTAESPTGERGLDHLGRVIDCAIVCRGRGNTSVRVAVELEAKATTVRTWGPFAVAGVGSWNSGTNTLTISQDHAGVGGGHVDTLGFTQPAYSQATAGALRVAIYQSEDGVTFPAEFAARADVASVTPATPSISLTSITGTIYRDTIKIIVGAPWSEQTAAWVLALYMPITSPTGLLGADKGYRL